LMMDDKVRALYDTIPESDRAPGVHLMTGPIFVNDARPGDLLEVRYLQMTPRFNYGSNLAAHWGHLYTEFEKERVTIYELDQASNTAHALYAY
ncbi:formamidase, partial [Paraburkholderia sp. SIMBA_050]